MYVRAPSGTRIEETEERIARGRGVRPQDDPRRRPAADHLRARRRRRLVGRLHPQRRPDGRRRQGPAHASDREQLGPGVRPPAPRRASPTDPRFADLEFAFDAGGMIRAAMNEGKSTPINIRVTGKNQRQARAIAAAIRRKVDPDRRRGRRPDHPAARLPRVHHQRRPRQGRRPGPDPGRRHEERRRRAQLAHPVQQEELLDRPGQQATSTSSACSTPRRTSSRSRRCWTSRSPARTRSKPIPLRNLATLAADDRADRGHPHQHPADDRPDDGRPRPRPRPRLRRRRRGPRRVRQDASPTAPGSPTTRPTVGRSATPLKGLEDRAQRRVLADAGDVPQPGHRPDPGVAADLLPDGRRSTSRTSSR